MTRTCYDIARRDTALARLTARAQQLLQLDRQFRKLLPPALAAGCHAVRIEGGELLIFADNGLIAARLRILAPGLLPRLAERGYPATSVKVRVMLRLETPPREKRLTISASALDRIEEAAASVRDPGIGAALARLIAHHRD